jgi:predicted nuclease of predicted toxin-antitoxin system
LRLLLDEDTQARRLVERLRQAGHDILTTAEAGLRGAPDADVLAFAARKGRVVLTRNCADYLELHRQDPSHHGILCIYQDSDPSKAMTHADIPRAIDNLEGAGVPLAGNFVALNAWLY